MENEILVENKHLENQEWEIRKLSYCFILSNKKNNPPLYICSERIIYYKNRTAIC